MCLVIATRMFLIGANKYNSLTDVTLLSGFSKNMVNMVVSDELDPFKALVKVLKDKRYDCVDSIEF